LGYFFILTAPASYNTRKKIFDNILFVCNFTATTTNNVIMATVALKQRTDSYWELIKDADSGVKIELIMRLSDALKSLIPKPKSATQAAVAVTTAKKAKKNWTDDLPIVTDEDFQLSSETLAMVAGLKPMDETVDYDEIKLQYLKEKYQL